MSDLTIGGPFDYFIFGLHIRSELSFPQLQTTQLGSDPQVLIRRVDAQRMAQSNTGAGDSQVDIQGIAQFRILAGNEILVHAEPKVPERNVILYLLGSAMGVLLHQRGLLPLHANGVEIGGKAVAFMGASGSGKSTLAAWFHDRGYRIVADDVCVVTFCEKGPMVSPGLPRLRLWREVLEASGRTPSHYDRSYVGADDWEKYDVPLSQDAVTTDATELSAIYLLEKGERFEIMRLTGMNAAHALFANTYRGRHVIENGDAREHWEACLRLVHQTPIFKASRAWSIERLNEQCVQILEHAQGIVSLDVCPDPSNLTD